MTIEEYYNLNEQEKLDFIQQVANECHQYNNRFDNSIKYSLYSTKKNKRITVIATIPQKYHQKNGGMLTYIDRLMIPNNNRAYYLVLCDCSRWSITRGDKFKKGEDEGNGSCGCKFKEAQFQKIDYSKIEHPHYLFIRQLNTKDNGNSYNWEIQCKKCGKKFELPPFRILDKIKSYNPCDCWRNSYQGEVKIGELLKNANINYDIQKTFPDLKGDKQVLQFDFYINNQYLIEYDGIGHYEPRCFGGMTQEQAILAFHQQQKYDNLKNQYCKEHNIPLIRIPYTHLSHLCLEDLLLETSKFIYKEED